MYSCAGEANADSPLLVGAVDTYSVVFEHLYGLGAGVSVLVIGSHADERDLGGKPCELFVCQATLTAVMGDLEKVDIAYLRYDALQRLAFGIACEQPTRLGIAVTVRVELEQPDEGYPRSRSFRRLVAQ